MCFVWKPILRLMDFYQSNARQTDCKALMIRVESQTLVPHSGSEVSAGVAQQVEQLTCNQ